MHAMLVTLLYDKEFRITHMEMIKGIKGLGYHDELVVPIIENTAHEADLKESMDQAIKAYPKATAVLVRRHGVYIWGYGHTVSPPSSSFSAQDCLATCIQLTRVDDPVIRGSTPRRRPSATTIWYGVLSTTSVCRAYGVCVFDGQWVCITHDRVRMLSSRRPSR
jgi:hypothetical protein